jgi:hypothetical protein
MSYEADWRTGRSELGQGVRNLSQESELMTLRNQSENENTGPFVANKKKSVKCKKLYHLFLYFVSHF